ncbi:hypothetical protein ABE504_07515 [Paenibacillus oryzisoli]|uniref:hypothetical protein n=1 Tax=Paenibacillus oryzisoli TaxID=1850517 RepID=UPI003D2A8E59
MEQGDVKVILLILIIFVGFLFWRFNKWLKGPMPKRVRVRSDADVPQDDVVELLEGAGFDVLAGKTKIPITMTINDRDVLESRLFIDYFAEKDGQLLLVKVARERKPLEMTGSGVREMLLPYSLMYPEAEGILYVDLAVQKIKKITFHIEV